nr:hypothetical protein [Flavobacterium sp. ASV13]
MKKALSVLILFCLFISCERKEPDFSEEMIDKLALRDNEKDKLYVFIPYEFSDVYLMTNHNMIFMTTENFLYVSYKKYYSKKYKSYKIFLETFLDKNFVLDENSPLIVEQKFKLNRKIEKEYTDLGFDKFLKKYSKVSSRKNELELNKSNFKSDEYFTIKYLLYLNKYDISVNCLIGIDYIKKRKNSFK